MKKPFILMIGTADTMGGAARQSWTLGQALRKKGYTVKWLVRTKKSNKNYVAGFFSPIKTLLYHFNNFIFSNDITFGLNTEILNNPWYKKADIVHLHNLHGNYFELNTLVKISKEKKIVWTLHDMWTLTGKSPYIISEKENHWIYPPMLFNTAQKLKLKKNKIYKNLKKINIVTPSIWLNKLTKKSTLKNNFIKTIYNGVDTDFFKPKTKVKLSKENNLSIITVIVSGGIHNPFKGEKLIKNLVKLIYKNKNFEFHIVGGNKNHQDENIFYKQHLDQKQLLEQYQISDAILVPSLADNCPLVILEALACCVPVIATKVGGIPELIKHKVNGYLSEPDTQDLYNGLKWLNKLSEKKKSKIKIENRQLAIKNFSISVMVNKYEELYHSLSS